MGNKQWTIPTILRELQRVTLEMDGSDIMNISSGQWDVKALIEDLTRFHMDKQMGIPGQTSILTDTPKKK